MMSKIEVLDGYVHYIDHMGGDNSPVESARMSTDTETGVDEVRDDKLRSRLWTHRHTSPFESPVLCVELEVPLFVLRQIDRHRTLDVSNPEIDIYFSDYDEFRKYTSRNEFSARYSVMPDKYYIPGLERLMASKKSDKNKQGSAAGFTLEEAQELQDTIRVSTMASRKTYESLIEAGVASEIARLVLPTNQYTKIRLQSCVLNWLKFLELRLPEEAQWECRQYAAAIASIIETLWPKTYGLARYK